MTKHNEPRGPFDFLIAKTREEIRHVYENGPSSCLSNKASHYLSAPVHPTEVLAAGDIQVAYIQDHLGIAARTLIWPRKLIYLTPIYDDWGTNARKVLMAELQMRAYKEARHGQFDGARLLKIPVTVKPPRQQHQPLYGIWPCWCFSCSVYRLGKPVHTFVAPGIDCTHNGISVDEDYLYIGERGDLPCTQPDHDKGVLL